MFIQKLIYIFKKKNIEIKQSPEAGIFVLKGQINNEQTYELIKGILDFSDKFPNKTITLYINSEGGSVTAGMAVYDTIRVLQNPIRTIGYGSVGGIATLLLAAGNKGMREIMNKTIISLGAFMINKEIEQPSKELYLVMEKVCKELEKNTGKTIEQIQSIIKGKEVIDAKRAIQIGLVDKRSKQGYE